METAIFESALGLFGIGWTEVGVARLQLPGLDQEALLARINRGAASPGEPPPAVAALIDEIKTYGEGGVVAFSHSTLDLTGVPAFHCRVYEALRAYGWGQTTTYGALARELSHVTLSRAVGQAMGANPIPLIIPCHRVLASDGKPGGFSAPGGAVSKLRMLAIEGVSVGGPAGQMAFGF